VKFILSVRTRPGQQQPDFPLSRRELTELMARILTALGLSRGALKLTLIDDRGMALLNREYLGCEGPTNILSFPETDPSRPEMLGELFLSAETLAREATLYGQEPARHLARLLAHGVLHLAGFDHGEEMDLLTEHAVEAACGCARAD
jgi:probable rRNA maturation factor